MYKRIGDELSLSLADYGIRALARECRLDRAEFFFGHSRLVTNGMSFNQPVETNGIFALHNGIVLNSPEIWKRLEGEPQTTLDSEVISAFAYEHVKSKGSLEGCWDNLGRMIKGAASCVVIDPAGGQCLLFSNTGSLYVAEIQQGIVVASERATLASLGATNVEQVTDERLIEIPSARVFKSRANPISRANLVPEILRVGNEEALLQTESPNLERCSKCILPETMPFIEFDEDGVCNYCANFRPQEMSGDLELLRELVQPYRRFDSEPEVIVPFSGGRDSTWALKLIVEDLGLRPVTFTYDWGMVTDLGRRNISLVTSMYGVENIVVASDIALKRRNIKRNLEAWLAKPHLGMISLLTAGDKHFYKFLEELKPRTGVSLSLWGINPWETTHFKAGFLGVPPDFHSRNVFRTGLASQIEYQRLRFREMLRNPRYINASIADTLTGEYYRSVKKKTDYFHVFNYFQWRENEVDAYLDNIGWERADDTSTSWRIGDGTAGFYNYVYHTVAGFSEHDTFRSNQIREGHLTRENALALVKAENEPRYASIKWYLDAVGVDFTSTIETIKQIPKLY